ncbi:WalW protein [Paraglaciecola sp. L3A3]|uniref:WalW protein n=1 Tax=Paraglaciecola sp. L3A3 TaxID=2686358 RepID=UPI00131DA221|nr:WalW protein [Paraglaciecola sp. L3A3]
MTQAVKENKPILFVLSIDTEEEWDWSGPFPQKQADIQNIVHIPEFHNLITGLGIRPTYFVDYAVLETKESIENICRVKAQDNCEIGAHLHPWCNPPYFEHVGEAESHVINLPIDEVEKKLTALVDKIKTTTGVAPKSFRTGRWGIDGKVMNLLLQAGFNVDSSVYPYYENEYFSCLGSPATPYWPDLSDPLKTSSQNKMYEIPVTVGFNQHNFELANTIHTMFTRSNLKWTRFNGLAWHTGLLRKNYLCPELSSVRDMINLCDMVIQKGYPVIHMYMHSSSLLNNNNNLLGQDNAFNHICHSIEQVINHLKAHYEIEFCTISEAAQKMQSQQRNKQNEV